MTKFEKLQQACKDAGMSEYETARMLASAVQTKLLNNITWAIWILVIIYVLRH